MLNIQKSSGRWIGVVAFAVLASGVHAQKDGGKYEPVIESTVRVLALMPDGRANYGTGWVIAAADKDNRAGAAVVVTARHVIEGAVKVTIVEPGSAIADQRVATVVSATAERDLAFLEVKDLNEPALTLTRTLPNVGDVIHALGYSSASDANEANGRAVRASPKMGGLSKAFRGPISSLAQAPIDQIEFDAPILAGFSGGPVVSECARVIGITVKDGGHLRLSEAAEVNVAQGVSVAVQSDEIVKAAHDSGIDVKVVDGACSAAAVPPPPPPMCSKPFISSEMGHPCLPPAPRWWESSLRPIGGLTGFILGIACLALIVVIGAVLVILNNRRKGVPPAEPQRIDIIRSSAIVGDPLPIRGDPPEQGAKTIRLTGRGPSGERIDLRFSANELVGSGVMLGIEGDEGARIPDTRDRTHVSRRHASLSYDGREFVIRDNKSTNYTTIGSKRLDHGTAYPLTSGDRLTLGDVVLNVAID